MTRVIRSRRAGVPRDQPLYARTLGLRHLAPNGFLCFVFLEGGVALGILLALAELVSWWGVLVLPATVAVMVKLNDVIAGTLARPAGPVHHPAAPATPGSPPLRPAAVRSTPAIYDDVSPSRARTVDLQQRGPGGARMAATPTESSTPSATAVDTGTLNGPSASRQWADQVDARQQMARQSATRRYE